MIAARFASPRISIISCSSRRARRRGLLVETAALERAEAECLAEAEVRARRRERDAERRAKLDAACVASFAERVRDLFPHWTASMPALRYAPTSSESSNGGPGEIPLERLSGTAS